jgi:hypothetical protein
MCRVWTRNPRIHHEPLIYKRKIHPGLRELLLQTFQTSLILDLGGDTRAGETELDDNVFEITQGVAISLWSNRNSSSRYFRVKGSRAAKYQLLQSGRVDVWVELKPDAPSFLLTPQNRVLGAEYDRFASLRELMPFSLPGVKTSNDDVFYAFSESELHEQIAAAGITWERASVTRSLYRPLDWRYVSCSSAWEGIAWPEG